MNTIYTLFFLMKNLLKLLIVCWLALGLGRYVFSQTPRWQRYWAENMTTLRSSILEVLDATDIVHTGNVTHLSGWEIRRSDSGTVIVDAQTLEQRLQYYRDNKANIWWTQ